MPTFRKDYQFGKKKEIILKPKIEAFFNDITFTTSNLCPYDLKGENHFYEIKSRNISSCRFDTTILPCSKLRENLICIFSFSDGDYYIKYDKEKFDGFQRKMFCRQKRSDYKDMPKEYIFIPVKQLNILS